MGAYGEWERQREARRLATLPAPRTAKPKESAHQSLLDLQRQAGNHAVSAMLRELAPAEPAADTDIAVSRDQAAETEADKVAEAAVAKLGPDASKAPMIGGTLSPTLRRALGAVAPDVGSIDRIRVHTDDAAGKAADSINARAFTSGRDVSVARGELRDHREGNRLLAHEAVHAARHQPQGAREVVHAKLRGTKDALVSQGGGETSGKLRKLAHSKTNWDKVIAAVGVYEELEAAVLKAGNPSPTELSKVAPKMIQQLARVEAACASWEKANPDNSGAKEKAKKKFEEDRELAETDDRAKAARRQAIAMLLPRIRLEMEDLKSGKWIQSLGLSDKQKTDKKGRDGKGQMNVVKEMTYATENGEFSGYFKADKGFAKEIQGHEAKVGIQQHDPNYGARSVAMYRIDKLLGAGVTARAEFAAHEGKLGTVLESAKGEAASEHKFALDDEQQEQLGEGTIMASDPVLQRAMNKLQILDAICGQLDRHQGNWYIETDKKTGKVKGVTGIDLDMAFGSEMQGVEGQDSGDAHNYMGMPDMIDEEFAQQILKVKPEDIRNALKGLLPANEINATVSRFSSVRDKIEQVAKTRGLTKEWNKATAEQSRLKKSTISSGYNSYTSQVSGAASGAAVDQMRKDAKSAIEKGEGPPPFRPELLDVLLDLPDKMAKGIRQGLSYQIAGSNRFKEAVWSGMVPHGQASKVAMLVINDILSDDSLMNRIIVAIQEMDEDKNPFNVVDNMIDQVMDKKLSLAVAKLGPVRV